MRWHLKPTLVIALMVSGLATAHAGLFDDIFKNVGKSIDKSVQDVGKSIEKHQLDVGKDIGKTIPEVEHSPPDPCANNAKLPQCEVGKIELSR